MCIDLYDNGDDHIASSNTAYVSVFPNGIYLSSKVWDLLYAKMNNTLYDYRMPYNLRNNMRTVEYYTITEDGTSVILSTDGAINSSTPFTGCSNTMQFSIEKCLNPPMKSTSTLTSPAPSQRNLIPTEQYKCSPFSQKTDLDKSGKNVKIGGGSLADIINNENVILTDQNNTVMGMFSDDFVKSALPAAAITIVGVIALGIFVKYVILEE
jgi:hypothetical protein